MEVCFACPCNVYQFLPHETQVTITVQCGVDVQGNNLSSLWGKQERKMFQILKVVLSHTNNVSQALPLNTNNILVFARNTDLNLTGSMSSHTRQPLPLFQVQCRVTLDRPVRCPRCNVEESHSTALSAVPGPMSSSNRHVILQCLILVFPKQLLSSGCCWTSNIIDLENSFGSNCWNSHEKFRSQTFLCQVAT